MAIQPDRIPFKRKIHGVRPARLHHQTSVTDMAEEPERKQLLHLVFGGELTSLSSVEFRDLKALDIVGIYPDYKTAEIAWKAKAQATVDNAHMRYFIVHLHRLLDPDAT